MPNDFTALVSRINVIVAQLRAKLTAWGMDQESTALLCKAMGALIDDPDGLKLLQRTDAARYQGLATMLAGVEQAFGAEVAALRGLVTESMPAGVITLLISAPDYCALLENYGSR
jgi:hypothetical protein